VILFQLKLIELKLEVLKSAFNAKKKDMNTGKLEKLTGKISLELNFSSSLLLYYGFGRFTLGPLYQVKSKHYSKNK